MTKVMRKYSVNELWKIFLRKVCGTQISKSHYLRLKIDIDKTNRILDGFDLDVKELSLEDFSYGDPNVFNEKKMEVYKHRCLDPTYKAYGIFENGRLIYSTWISLHNMGMIIEKSKPIYLASNEGLLEDSYCAPCARGRGLHWKMNNYRIKKIYEQGKDTVIAIVIHGNTPAFKVQFKSGFKEVGTFWQGYLFGLKVNTFKKEKFEEK